MQRYLGFGALLFAVTWCGQLAQVRDASIESADATTDGGALDAAPPNDASNLVFTCAPSDPACDASVVCDPRTQYCILEMGGPNQPHYCFHECLAPDGGSGLNGWPVPPTCADLNSPDSGVAPPTYPGGCGCYESDTGEVTFTECPP